MRRPWWRTGRRRGRSAPLVLLYHRVGSPLRDPQLLAVTPEHFAEQLELLADQYVPVPLDELVTAATAGRAPKRAVAITFDDGYVDNLTLAKPLLGRFAVPATVYVSSGYVASGRPFWWDELERLLLAPGRLPADLRLEIGRDTLRFELDGDATYTPARAADDSRWTVLDDHDPGPRHRVYRTLCDRLRRVDAPDQQRALDELRSIADPVGGPEETDAGRPLAIDELVSLSEGGAIDIGAHTVTHPALALLPLDRQREEVEGSKRQLEQVLGRPIRGFSFPYGTAADFDGSTVALVREAGFTHACANVPGRLRGRVDPFRLPRILVRDWSADELARRLTLVEG